MKLWNQFWQKEPTISCQTRDLLFLVVFSHQFFKYLQFVLYSASFVLIFEEKQLNLVAFVKGHYRSSQIFSLKKIIKWQKNKKQIGDVWKNGRKCYSYIQLNTWYENWCQSLRFVTQIAVLAGRLRGFWGVCQAPFLIHESISNFDTSLQGWTEGNFWRPKQKEKQKEKKLLPLAKGRSRRFSNLKF